MNKSTKAFFGMLGAALGLGIVNGPAKADQQFTVGTPGTQTYFQWTVTNNGNLRQFQTGTFDAIVPGSIIEGYQLATQRIGGLFVDGYDIYDSGFATSGFDVAVVTTTGLPTGYVYRSSRKTGSLLGAVKLKLVQDFKPDVTAATPTSAQTITINCTVTNLEASTVNNVTLSRIVDFDPGSGETWGRTKDAIFSFQAVGGGGSSTGTGGVYLQASTFATATGTYVDTFVNNYNARGTASPNLTSVSTPAAGDYSGRVFYNLGSLAAGASKTVKFIYRRL